MSSGNHQYSVIIPEFTPNIPGFYLRFEIDPADACGCVTLFLDIA
jgi:hypothetical protein